MKDAYYFSHDANARNDPDILAMRSKYGTEGYGMYWMLIEMLREQSDYTLKHTQYISYALAMQAQCDQHYAEEFINDCISEFDLLQTDGEKFWSDSLLRRMAKKDEKSEQARKAAMARWNKTEKSKKESGDNADAMRPQCDRNAIKESKGKESKDNKPEIDPQLDVQKTDKGNVYPSDFEKVWKHYPRKVKKKAAWRKWRARRKEGVENGELIAAAKNYALDCKKSKTEEEFIQHGSTFFGPDEHYADYINGLPRGSPDTNGGSNEIPEADKLENKYHLI